MKKFLVGFYLPVAIFLSGVYSQLYAHRDQDSVIGAPIDLIIGAEQAAPSIVAYDRTVAVKSDSQRFPRERYKMDIPEIEEEDDLVSHNNKHFEGGYFSSVFCILFTGTQLRSSSFRLQFRKLIPHIFSSNRYLVLQVFRI